ncbi:MAG: SpoIIIAC/SpoIIIAD family protein [Eubacteriales bacterium]|nr:SpoIIIAC/SpoIIIAD family protein [Eubacteriales bacterium]
MIVQIVLAGLVTAMLSILVRQYRPEHAMGISIVFGIAVFALAAVKFTAIFQDLYQLLQTAGIRQDYFSMLIKAVGIG